MAIFSSRLKEEVTQIKDTVKEEVSEIQGQLSDHLQSINDNTNEIQSNYEYLCEIDNKISKLNERIDELTMLLRQQGGETIKDTFDIDPLTHREKEVFYAIYTLEHENGSVCYKDISRRTMMPETLVKSYIINLVEKGVPLVKRYVNHEVFLRIDTQFRDIQTKENLVGITQKIVQSLA